MHMCAPDKLLWKLRMMVPWPSTSSASLVAGWVHVGQMGQTLGLGLLP